MIQTKIQKRNIKIISWFSIVLGLLICAYFIRLGNKLRTDEKTEDYKTEGIILIVYFSLSILARLYLFNRRMKLL